MRVRIDEPGQDDLAGAVDLGDAAAISLQPGIAEGVFRSSDRNDLAAQAEDCAIFDDRKILQMQGRDAGRA